MRLWSIHPSYLDAKGLVALWRETLLAQNVLLDKTKGYKNHPQLNRFKACENPCAAIAAYLRGIADEADRRAYHFNRDKIISEDEFEYIRVNKGQLDFEFKHLLNKLGQRDPARFESLKSLKKIKTHSLFIPVAGGIEDWEVLS